IYIYNSIIRTINKLYGITLQTAQIVNRDINKELWNRMNEIKEKQMITTTIVNISYLVKELAVSIMILNIKLQNMNEKIANKRIFKSIIGLMYNRMNTTVKKKIIEDIKQKVERKVKKQKEYKEFQGYLKINQDENLGVDYKEINTLNKEIKQVSEDKRYNQNSNNDYKINRQQEQQRTNRFRNNNGFNRFNKATTKTNKCNNNKDKQMVLEITTTIIMLINLIDLTNLTGDKNKRIVTEIITIDLINKIALMDKIILQETLNANMDSDVTIKIIVVSFMKYADMEKD
ncbi:hypothetical protein RFI_39548, partial [Reticulomyxa filosa]